MSLLLCSLQPEQCLSCLRCLFKARFVGLGTFTCAVESSYTQNSNLASCQSGVIVVETLNPRWEVTTKKLKIYWQLPG